MTGARISTSRRAASRVGKPLFVKFARIGVQDEIGVLTQAKSTI
jgi:ethanolamine ammonia-lyase small subunit